jgi:hypothetical protein
VDKALRDRVTEFYGYHVREEYRKAEKLVAEDSQDLFYIHDKPKYESFKIHSIEYRDHFTKAKVTCTVEQFAHAMGFNGKLMTMPSMSSWKVENGQWFWYVDPDELAHGPFGKSANAGTKPAVSQKPEINIPSTPDFALGKVALDKDFVVLPPQGTAEITITNGSLGTIQLAIYQVLPGIKVTLDKTQINRGEKAIATLKGDDNPHTGKMAFQFSPTDEVLWFDVKRQ